MALTIPADETLIHSAAGPITLMPPVVPGGDPVPQMTGPIDKDAFPNGIEAVIKHTVYRRVVFGVTGVADGVVKRFYLKEVLPSDIKVLQSVPDNFLAASNGNAQYRADNVGVNVHGVSYANLDKPSSTYVLTSNKCTSLNLAAAITARKAARALGLSTSHIHSATWWHNGHSSSQTWAAGDWKAQQDVAVNGWVDGLQAEGLWAGTETWDIVNETVDDANQTPVPATGAVPYVRQSKLTIAAKADASWATEMAAFGLSATDAGNLGWLYTLFRAKQKMAAVGNVARLYKADYSIGESGAPWGPGVLPAGFPASASNGHFMMRQERFFEDAQKQGAVRKAGYDMPTLHMNFQNHVKLSNLLFLDNIRDRQQRCNLLKKRVIIGEITLEIITDEVAQMLTSIGIPVTPATIDRLGCNYIAMMLSTIIEHTERVDAIQPWTALGAVGELVTSAYDLDGNPTCVYRGIQKAGQILPARRAIRAGSTHFAMPSAGFRPFDFIPGGTVTITGAAGLRAPGSKMPWSHYQRVVADDGQQENMDPKNWDQAITIGLAGSAAANSGQLVWGQESASGNSLRFVWDSNYGLVMQLYPADGSAMQSVPLGRVGPNNFARIAVAGRSTGQVRAAVSVLDPSTGTVTDLAPVTANVQLADPVNYLMPEGANRGVYKHKIWDVTDLTADTAALAARARLTSRLGSPLTVQELWDGVAA